MTKRRVVALLLVVAAIAAVAGSARKASAAPQGAKLARQVGPVVGHAITEDSDTNNPGNQP